MVEAIANNLKSDYIASYQNKTTLISLNYAHIMHISPIYGYFKVSYFAEYINFIRIPNISLLKSLYEEA
jgi:hypothetical protein